MRAKAASRALLAAWPVLLGGLLVVAGREAQRDARRRQRQADQGAAQPHPALYRRTGRLSPAIEAPGTVDFDNNQATSVVSPFTGPVTRIFVALGQPVAKGQPLAAVASADVANAVAAYRKAAVGAANARRVAAADRDLAAHNGISEREAAQAQTDAASAEADRVARAPGAGVDRARASLGIRAGAESFARPSPASSSKSRLLRGSCCRPAHPPPSPSPICRRSGFSRRSHPSDLAAVGFRDAATIDPGNGTGPFHGTVENIGASVDPNTRAIVARIVAPNPGGLLKKQMYVDVSIESGRVSTGLLVPVSAVLRDDQNLPFVYLALPDGSFARRHVTLGYRDSQNYDVTSGLAERRQGRFERRALPPVHAEPMSDEPDAEPPRTGSSFINRIVALSLEQRILVAVPDGAADRRRHPRVGAAAGRRLSRSVAADGLDHRAMARPLGGRGGTADHRSDRARDERHPERE